MRNFGIGMEWSGDAVHLRVRGDLDISVADSLLERVEAMEGSSAQLVIVDLAELTFLDSSGLKALLAAQQAGADGGFEVLVVRTPKAVRRVIDVAGADRILRLADQPG
jgi:stage II sporulation protein AA (anti-sigma F factor antagonist)